MKLIKRKIKRFFFKRTEIIRNSRELIWSQVFNSTIANSSWLKIQSFSPGRWAVGYPLLYIMYRILNDVKPKSILEFGLGESTKMTYQYASNHEGIDLNVIEQNQDWVDYFVQNKFYAKDMITILPIENVIIEGYEVNAYAGLMDSIKGKKFDFVIIDGPWGSSRYSRHQIVNIIDADQLEDSFIILIDDACRIGEQDTIDDICIHLRNVGKKFCIGKKYRGAKESVVICSSNYQFLVSL